MSAHVTRLIEEVLTGRVLSAKDEGAFQSHLAVCESCRAHYDFTLGVLRLARGGVHVAAPGEVKRQSDRVLRLVKDLEPTPPSWPWKTLFAGAVVLAAVVLAIFAWPRAEVGVVLQAGKGLMVDGVVASKDTVLLEGAVITTGKEDCAVLLRDEVHKRGVLLRPDTSVRVVSVDEVELVSGRVRLQVKDPKGELVVRTEALRVVQDTAGVFIVEKVTDDGREPGKKGITVDGRELIAVHQGKVVVRSGSDRVELNEGQEAELANGKLTSARPVAGNSLIEDRGDGTVWDAILRFLRQLLDVIAKALAGD